MNTQIRETVAEAPAAIEIPPHTAELFQKIFQRFKPPRRMPMSEWAETYRKLSEGNNDSGKWRVSRAPFQKAIMDAISDPRVERVVIMSASQLGKTEAFILNGVGYFMHLDPARMIILEPTIEMAEGLSKERFTPACRETPILSKLVNESRSSGNTIRLKLFPGGFVALLGANSPSSLSSRPVRIVFLDEVDRYSDSAGKEGDPVALVETRTSTFWNRKIVMASTPSLAETSRIKLEFDNSTQEIWNVPCPVCGKLQPLEWGQIVFDRENLAQIGHTCIKCGTVSSETAWKNAQANGEYIANFPDREVRGFHLNALASPWKSWKQIVEEFLKANTARKNGNIELMKEWVNTVLGQVWEEDGDSVDAEDFLARRETYGCMVPERVLHLTAAVDVQEDRLEVEVVGWGLLKESWGIQYERIYGDPEKQETWDRLDLFLEQPFHKADGTAMYVDGTAVDTGYKALTVYRYCKPRELKNVYAIKGQGGVYPFIGKGTRNNRAEALVFPVGSNSGKDILLQRLKVEPPAHIDEPCGGYCHFPDDPGRGYDEYYFNTLTAEKKVLHYVKGRQRFEWVPKRTGARNEGLDLRVYATAALEIRNFPLDPQKAAAPKKKRRRGVVKQGI